MLTMQLSCLVVFSFSFLFYEDIKCLVRLHIQEECVYVFTQGVQAIHVSVYEPGLQENPVLMIKQ